MLNLPGGPHLFLHTALLSSLQPNWWSYTTCKASLPWFTLQRWKITGGICSTVGTGLKGLALTDRSSPNFQRCCCCCCWWVQRRSRSSTRLLHFCLPPLQILLIVVFLAAENRSGSAVPRVLRHSDWAHSGQLWLCKSLLRLCDGEGPERVQHKCWDYMTILLAVGYHKNIPQKMSLFVFFLMWAWDRVVLSVWSERETSPMVRDGKYNSVFGSFTAAGTTGHSVRRFR